MIEVLVISISTPLLVGIYKDKQLIKTYEKEGMTSDILPSLFKEILTDFKIVKIYYVNTPGSYMAIKVAYIFLKSISIVKNISLEACCGFEFNENSPIKAIGKKYFINSKDGIKVDFLENNCKMSAFKLPESLKNIKSNIDTLPIYNLPAV
ncbi:hypothetical protein [Halarcobacter ebronensis]|uniref:Glycoprotease n=1 Tax=Halarcobacter ebronensis TaxID=1462615 RepID=A0A4V1M0J4_9BACT|nr:hypothetical protein [Halarcobacter ebronensis]QKF80935.1 N6-L-threonylcarbamoyladenine synthase, TsaB subunit [Halarcobacter ebronensis]RXK06253.1 hypothetical protein CRV07_06020 [Halarcobacter ebronensis]